VKISEIRDEKAVEVLADSMEPIIRLCKNAEVYKAAQSNVSIELAKSMVKADPKAVLEILAICNQVPIEENHPTPFEILRDLAGILTDPAISSLFFSQEPKAVATASGSATENTTEKDQPTDS
jgi:hypothetical protein